MANKLKISSAAKAKKYFQDKMAFTTGPVELERWAKQGQPVNIVDVRAAEDYAEGRIPGAVNLPKDQWQDSKMLKARLRKDKINVVYCYSHVCHLAAAAALAVLACSAGDTIWYELGRHRGRHALNLLCRISLEPDSCVRRTENLFTRHGIRALIMAKFIPGLSTITPALAGLFGVGMKRFLFYNGLGALLWTVAFMGPGFLFSAQLEDIAAQAAHLGSWLAFLLGGGLGTFIIYKYVHRHRLLRELRTA